MEVAGNFTNNQTKNYTGICLKYFLLLELLYIIFTILLTKIVAASVDTRTHFNTITGLIVMKAELGTSDD